MPDAQSYTDERQHQPRLNRHIHNEYLTDSVIMGQGRGATVTINDGVSRNSIGLGRLHSNPVPYQQRQGGYCVDEGITNRNNGGMLIISQGTGAQAILSESAAAMLIHRSAPVSANQADERLQWHQERQAREYHQWLSWEYHRRQQLAYTIILSVLQHIMVQLSLPANRAVAGAGIAATTQHVPPSEIVTQSSPELNGQGGTPAVINPSYGSTNLERSQSGRTMSPPPPISESQNAPSSVASASTQNGEVHPIIDILQSLKTRLTSWFSRKLKG
ncbi:hypothetical protein AGABI2DRAFT_189155, partial [Agaricus bisporus var. bisporus H97]|uniref:hypothetical protein n=1 Tax=Agaricus bisporus var. bisporus (strain H97 / ATCC MYA-4626 / FGSC 10389) TaxID=936046 RepID=UPI00029F79F9